MMPEQISLSEARRMALAAQGFGRPRARRVTPADIARTIRQLALVQLDFVNLLVPAHYTVLFSRLGPYQRSLLDDAVYRQRQFTEHWAHEASIVPMETWPLLQYRRETYRVRPWGFEKFLARHPEYVQWVLEQVRERGALTADVLAHPEGTERRMKHCWVGTTPRAVLETHFGRGALAIASRLPNFARAYDLAERIVPGEHHARRWERDAAQRELLSQAARAHAIGTAADLADYFRMPVRDARPRLAELVEEGRLREARVEGWREAAYLHAGASPPPGMNARALLAPFDPLVWFRPRVRRLFEFDFRFEIFVPEHQVKYGRYVMPFLLGDRLVARVDVKADRGGRRLAVLNAHAEPGVDTRAVAAALAGELKQMASWLELEAFAVGRRGNLARELGRVSPRGRSSRETTDVSS